MKKSNLLMRIGVLLMIAVMATTGVFVGTGTAARFVAEGNVEATARVARFDVRAGIRGADGNFPTTTNFARAGAANAGIISTTTTLSGPLWDTGNWPANPLTVSTTAGAHLERERLINGQPGFVRPAEGTIIAPGTGGRIDLRFANYSEVAVRFFLDDTLDVVAHIGSDHFMQPNPPTPTVPSPPPTRIDIDIDDANIQFSRTGINGGNPNDTANWGDIDWALEQEFDVASPFAAFICPDYDGAIVLPPNTPGSDETTIPLFWRWRFQVGTPDPITGITPQDRDDTTLGVAAAFLDPHPGTEAGFNNRPGLQLTLQVRAEQVD